MIDTITEWQIDIVKQNISHYCEATIDHSPPLHCLTQHKNPNDFEEQILSLTKVLIYSLNEAELIKTLDETNSEVAKHLKELNAADKNAVKGGISKFELFF